MEALELVVGVDGRGLANVGDVEPTRILDDIAEVGPVDVVRVETERTVDV